MQQNDPLVHPGDFAAALALLSRWPLRPSAAALTRGAKTAWCWPLVGLVLAALAAVFALALQGFALRQSWPRLWRWPHWWS